MTAPRHQEQRPNRRATDRGRADTPDERRRRLVRMLAADPELLLWLGTHNAKVLERAARHLALAGEHSAASKLRHVATAYRMGDTDPM